MQIVKKQTTHGVVYVDAAKIKEGARVLKLYTADGRPLEHFSRKKSVRERAAKGISINALKHNEAKARF